MESDKIKFIRLSRCPLQVGDTTIIIMAFSDPDIPCVVVTGPEPACPILEVCYPSPEPYYMCESSVQESVKDLPLLGSHCSRQSVYEVARHFRLSRLGSWVRHSASKKNLLHQGKRNRRLVSENEFFEPMAKRHPRNSAE